MKKWYGTMVFIFARPTDWMPIPVRICWSEKDWRSLRDIGAEVDFRRPRRMMEAERRMESMFVIIKDRSVCEVWGQYEDLCRLRAWVQSRDVRLRLLLQHLCLSSRGR